MNAVKLSVVMPAYNVQQFIGEAIQSVLNQSFKDFELLIVNDGSTDETQKIAESFVDPRIKIINQNNRGIAAALNTGLAAASASLIIRFDADDICYPHRFIKQYQFMQDHPEYVMAGCCADYIDENGNYIYTETVSAKTDAEIRRIVRHTCPFIHSGVIVRKHAMLRYGGYNENAHSFEDHLLWLSVLKEGMAYNFNEPLIQVRLNPASVTIDEKWRPQTFHRIKQYMLEHNSAETNSGNELLKIIRKQNKTALKKGAYHCLIAKKFLWNNYQPKKAREHLRHVIRLNRLHTQSYILYLLSFMPASFLTSLYKTLKPAPAVSYE